MSLQSKDLEWESRKVRVGENNLWKVGGFSGVERRLCSLKRMLLFERTVATRTTQDREGSVKMVQVE